MKVNLKITVLTAILAISVSSCREDYIPPTITTDYNYLVVEGFVNIGADSSFFTLSRTQPPGQSTANTRERNAQLFILNADGSIARTAIQKPNGVYAFSTAALSSTASYSVRVVTADGKEYLSEPVAGKITPVIDSVTYSYDPGENRVNFFANTHDASNNTRYYRWEYTETWEYKSQYNSVLEYNPATRSLIDRIPAKQIFTCWGNVNSSNIVIGSTAALSQDVISQQYLYYVPYGARRFNVRYSVNVKQHALTEKAYSYWQSLRRMNEQGGSIFDAQPTELIGNYRCVTDPATPVIGFLSVNSVTEKRIFIGAGTIPQMFQPYPVSCADTLTGNSPTVLAALYSSGNFVPAYPGDETNTFIGSTADCVDCRIFGGVNVKPSFW